MGFHGIFMGFQRPFAPLPPSSQPRVPLESRRPVGGVDKQDRTATNHEQTGGFRWH